MTTTSGDDSRADGAAAGGYLDLDTNHERASVIYVTRNKGAIYAVHRQYGRKSTAPTSGWSTD